MSLRAELSFSDTQDPGAPAQEGRVGPRSLHPNQCQVAPGSGPGAERQRYGSMGPDGEVEAASCRGSGRNQGPSDGVRLKGLKDPEAQSPAWVQPLGPGWE